MYQTRNLLAEISAANAYHGRQERAIQKITNIPVEEEPPFDILLLSKSFSIYVHEKGGFFEPFDHLNKPKGIKHIKEIEQLTDEMYRVTCKAVTTHEQIRAELESLYLPF